MVSRRKFLARSGGLLASTSLGASLGTVFGSRLALADASTEARLVVVILRGGLDGLHAVPPYADSDYRQLRPTLRIDAPGTKGSAESALDLNGYFGLHPSLKYLHNSFREGELVVVPAAATGYRKRSHFDAQNVLETGTTRPFATSDGWLNRAVTALSSQKDRRLALSIGHAVPLILRGGADVQTWAPSHLPDVDDDLIGRLSELYSSDPRFAKALRLGVESDQMLGMGNESKRSKANFSTLAEAAGSLLAMDDGPRVAVLEANGWDTHFGQRGRLSRQLQQLDAGISTLRTQLGTHWRETAVIVVSEFGRTARENGSRGTDHGTGGVAFVLGGAVDGGKVLGKWPGLSSRALFEARDVAPANDYHALFKAVLRDHLRLSTRAVNNVFANSQDVAPLRGIILS